jgi:hypothetical protein
MRNAPDSPVSQSPIRDQPSRPHVPTCAVASQLLAETARSVRRTPPSAPRCTSPVRYCDGRSGSNASVSVWSRAGHVAYQRHRSIPAESETYWHIAHCRHRVMQCSAMSGHVVTCPGSRNSPWAPVVVALHALARPSRDEAGVLQVPTCVDRSQRCTSAMSITAQHAATTPPPTRSAPRAGIHTKGSIGLIANQKCTVVLSYLRLVE